MQDFAWHVRVFASPNGPATVRARDATFEVGAPLRFDNEDPRLTSLEYLLGAFGADLVGGFAASAKRHRLRIDGLEAAVSGRLNNPLTFLGVVGEQGDPGVERLSATLYVSSDGPDTTVQAVWADTLDRSPMVHTFRRCVRLETDLKLIN